MICRPWRARRWWAIAGSWWRCSATGADVVRPVGASHVHHRHAAPVAQLLLRREHGGGDSRPGIQIFSWIATLWRGNVQRATRRWFLLGFFGVFVLGGLTGVMLAVVPLRLAGARHLFRRRASALRADRRHGVPAVRAIYYWAPLVGGRPLVGAHGHVGVRPDVRRREPGVLSRCTSPGCSACRGASGPTPTAWAGTPEPALHGRRVRLRGRHRIVLIDLLLHLRPAGKVDANPWNAGTLEWLPLDNYAHSQHSAHHQPRAAVGATPTARRKSTAGSTICRAPLTGDARNHRHEPHRCPAAISAAAAGAELAAAARGRGHRRVLPGAHGEMDDCRRRRRSSSRSSACSGGCGRATRRPRASCSTSAAVLHLPDYISGSRSHSWWSMVVLMLVDGSIFACLIFRFFICGR